MKFLIVFALFVGAFGAPNYGGSEVRFASGGYGSSGFLKSSLSSFDASPVLRSSSLSSYDSPALVRECLDCDAPIVRTSSYAAPLEVRTAEQIPIVRQVLNDDNYGTYDLDFESGNGIRSSENGLLRDLGGPYSEGPVSVKSGSYSYISPEGIPISTSWVADENGFRASGAHLPVPPPIPAEIARSLHSGSSFGGYSSAPAIRLSSGFSHEPLLLKSSRY